MSDLPLSTMENDSPAIHVAPTVEQAKRALRREIESKWGKFSEKELNALKNNTELVSQIAAKYAIEIEKAKADVDAMMNGRHL